MRVALPIVLKFNTGDDMWMIVDSSTGEIVTKDHDIEPLPEAGQKVVRQSRARGVTWHPASQGWAFDDAAILSLDLQDNLPALKAAKWEAVKARRDVARDGGCATPLGYVDTDINSRLNITGAFNGAKEMTSVGLPFSVAWTMHDNSTVDHDAPAMITMGMLVMQHIATCYAIGVAKREAIEEATTAEEVDAVSVEDGWPT